MRARVMLLFTAAVLASSCKGVFTVPPEPGEGDGVRPQCAEIAEPLVISPAVATVGSGQLLVLTASGGTGDYRFLLTENASGAEIASTTGVYVAGAPDAELATTIDIVQLEDRGCRGEAVASIEVVEAPSIAPRRVAVGPGESITFEGSGGSGSYRFELVTSPSGATMEDARYTAGPRTANDVVRLTDTVLGSSADALVEVSPSAGLALSPTEWVIPVGSQAVLPLTGGSGEVEVEVSGTGVEAAGPIVRATAAGAADVTFTDRFTRGTVTAHVRAVAPHEAERRHQGDRAESHVVSSGSYDIDGDGHFDAVVGMSDTSAEWFDSGVVRIYRGMAGGLEPAAVRTISGRSRDEEYGRALAIADIDEDGLLDLLVGARRADPTQRDVGAVYVYPGVAGGFFAESPSREWYGQSGFDLFGHAIAVCDFNADGHQDVAIAAPFAGRDDSGVVQVFLYRSDSARLFASAPSVTIAGELPSATEDDGWGPPGFTGLRLGEAIAAGDFDGDGACDVAAYALGSSEAQLNSGAVFLYRGRRGEGADRGGVETVPTLFWARADGVDDDSRFGQSLGLGDVNGDGLADLLASRSLYDGSAGSDTGALYLLHGHARSDPASAITDIAEADWSVEGTSADRMGHVATIVPTPSGLADVVSGDSRAGIMDSERTRPGVVRIYRGRSGGPDVVPSEVHEGPLSDERFGLGAGVIGDLDADGRGEVLAFAPYSDTVEGTQDELGALYLARSAGGLTRLETPRANSGQRAGQSVAWIGDLDGDGFPELAIGSSATDVTGSGLNLGVVRIHRGRAGGVDPAPAQVLSGFERHSESDELGWVVAPAGDFDGDGALDLAVLSRSEDLPATLDPAVYDVGAGCAQRDNASAILVFRGAGDGTIASSPAFAIFGPEANQRVDSIAGGRDLDGDGLADLLVGSREWDDGPGNNAGGVAIVRGRAAVADRIVAICSAEQIVHGPADGARLGASIVILGDLDRPADGCAEWATGAPEADPNETSNAGEVYVHFPACGATPERVVRLFGTDRDAQGGLSLAGGEDFDGDGVPDLLVGAPRFRDGRGEVGRVILVSGAYVASRTAAAPFLDPTADGQLVVDGSAPGERLGEALSMVRAASGALAILGAPFGDRAGRVDTGGVVVYGVDATGFGAPVLRVSGEMIGESQLGAAVHAMRAGGSVFVAVGAPWSTSPSSAWVDDGASYAFTIP